MMKTPLFLASALLAALVQHVASQTIGITRIYNSARVTIFTDVSGLRDPRTRPNGGFRIASLTLGQRGSLSTSLQSFTVPLTRRDSQFVEHFNLGPTNSRATLQWFHNERLVDGGCVMRLEVNPNSQKNAPFLFLGHAIYNINHPNACGRVEFGNARLQRIELLRAEQKDFAGTTLD